MNPERQKLFQDGMRQLPTLPYPNSSRNGEALDTDEAAIWKRVLNYRLASFLRPRLLLETHPGVGVSTSLYRHASPKTDIFYGAAMLAPRVDLIDVDPFGSPWDTLQKVKHLISRNCVVQVSNGEAHAVRRNLRRGQKYPTRYFGRRLPQWVVWEYLPRLQSVIGLKVRFFYAFPTTVRAILAEKELPETLWEGCPRWMWWLRKYAVRALPGGLEGFHGGYGVE